MSRATTLDAARMPVIVGVGQLTDTTTPPAAARSPLALMVEVSQRAAADAGNDGLLAAIDSIAVVRSFSDTVPAFRSPFGRLENAPWSVARRIGCQPSDLVYAPQGGDTPQTLTARACERIAAGDSQVALIVGAEALRTQLAARREGVVLDWHEAASSAPEELDGPSQLYTPAEVDHGMRSAIAMYALIEQAWRGAKGQSPAGRQAALGTMFERFAAVAAANPLATRRENPDAAAIATVTSHNPVIGFPYTKQMTANIYVDQAASLIVCSEAKAAAFGLPREQWVYLRGCGEAHDQWFVSDRASLHTSPAIRRVACDTLSQAGVAVPDIALFDIYSCFGSAVQIACDELGIGATDPRGLTVTGGLPFFGGPGNNYVTHAIAEMVTRLRNMPGAWGLVTANGGLLTKHAAGLYSTMPPSEPWRRPDPAAAQREIEALPLAPTIPDPHGGATIETYTVVHGRAGPETGIVIGRMDADGRRFVANTPSDPGILAELEAVDSLRRPGLVTSTDGRNVFTPAGLP